MTGKQESVLTVPVELARGYRGISIDIGSSMIKFVYRSQEDKDEVSSQDVKLGHLHLAMFPRRELHEALDYVRHRADITRTGDEAPTVHTTGVGCTQFGKLVSEKLNVKLAQLTEFDCFVKSLVYLAARLPRGDILEPFDADATVEPLDFMRKHLAVLDNIGTEGLSQGIAVNADSVVKGLEVALGRPTNDGQATARDAPLSEAEPDAFPCVLAMCGSGFGFMKVEKDGTFKLVDASSRGGKAFLAIGTLLTKCQTFTELLDLAARGNNQNVDQYTDALYDREDIQEGDNSIYTMTDRTPPGLVYCFGRALGSTLDELKPEDLARAWLNYVVLDLVQIVHYMCLRQNAKRVLFSGSFCSHPLVRRVITTELVRRNLVQIAFASGSVIQFDFIKPGAHLGAIGCAINDVDKFL